MSAAIKRTVEVPPHIVTCAVRYALGRRSYIVGDVCDLVTRLADDLGDQRTVIAEDVRRFLVEPQFDRQRPSNGAYTEKWRKLYDHLVAGDENGRNAGVVSADEAPRDVWHNGRSTDV